VAQQIRPASGKGDVGDVAVIASDGGEESEHIASELGEIAE
jgi:hypothetical protein